MRALVAVGIASMLWSCGGGSTGAFYPLPGAGGSGSPPADQPAALQPSGQGTTPPLGNVVAAERVDVPLTKFVNPFIGSGQVPKSDSGSPEDMLGGFINPGANVPFGMVSWGAETGIIPDTWSPRGYHYGSTTINGFPMINLSGVGCPTEAPFRVQPVASANDGAANFSHQNEAASPGYYRVQFDNKIATELTATARTGLGRFTFPAGGGAILKFDTISNVVVDLTARTISGTSRGGGFCGSSTYSVFFFAKFDQAFTAKGSVLTFTPQAGAPTVVGMKAGVSYVSVTNAKANLEAESSALSFDDARKNADSAWNERLNAIQVTGGSDTDKTVFYTALYHSFFAPSVFNDVNGEYASFDGRGTVEKVAKGHSHYTTFSSWDTYRSLTPLQALLAPQEASDMAQSLVNDAAQCGGTFPMWAEGTSNSNIMPGDGASIIVSQFHAFGARDFDTAAARKIMLDTATGAKTTCGGVTTLPHIQDYIRRGYLADGEGETRFDNSPTSNTMEYVATDFAISSFAAALDKKNNQPASSDVSSLLKRSGNWKNLFNPDWRSVQGQPYPQLQPRNAQGAWASYTPGDGNFREGNAEQYTFMQLHDIRGLFRALVKDPSAAPNSEADAIARLDAFTKFLNAGGRNDYPHAWVGNEPSFGAPFLYNWTSQPHKTQAVVRKALTTLFDTSAQGLPGNDDEGAMSGWYVWAALGLYPQIPSVPGVTLTAPLFKSAVVWQGKKRLLTISAPNASPSQPYIRSVTLNGKAHDSTWLPLDPAALENVALDFVLSDKPGCWASNPDAKNLPPSFSSDGTQTPALTPAAACSFP